MLSWLRRSGLGLLAEQDAVRRYAAANLCKVLGRWRRSNVRRAPFFFRPLRVM
jgi:hypothetical protein